MFKGNQSFPLTTDNTSTTVQSDSRNHIPAKNYVDSLCYDVLSEIFLHCAGAHAEAGNTNERGKSLLGLPRASTRCALVSLTHVCSHWRTVALRSKRLWSGFYVGGRRNGGCINPDMDMLALRLFSQRSGELPLRICVDFQDAEKYVAELNQGRFDINPSGLTKLCDLLGAVSALRPRIQEFGITMPRTQQYLGYMSDLTLALLYRRLNVLTITFKSKRDRALIFAMLFHKITDLTIIGSHLDDDVYSRKFTDFLKLQALNDGRGPHALERLSLINYSHPNLIVRDLNKRCLNISKVRIEYGAADGQFRFPERWEPMHAMHVMVGEFMNNSVAQLSMITSLELVDGHFFGLKACIILANAEFPALTELHLDVSRHSRLSCWPYLYTMLKKSTPPLKKLGIRGTSMAPQEFVDCLDLVSRSLEELTADGDFLTGSVVNALTLVPPVPQVSVMESQLHSSTPIESGPSALCPFLRKIVFDTCSSCSVTRVQAMILSRVEVLNGAGIGVGSAWGSSALKEVKLVHCSEHLRSLPILPQMQKLQDRRIIKIDVE